MKKDNQLLTRILSAVKGAPTVEANAEQALADLAATHAAEFSEMRIKADAELSAMAEALAQMTGKFDAAQAALDALHAEQAAALVTAEAAKLAARKEQVIAAIGTEKAEGLMLATHGLDDAGFAAVLAALAGSVEAEATTSMFVETGVAAAADTTKIVAESAEMRLLKQKFSDAP